MLLPADLIEKILIVDDDPDVVTAITIMLKDEAPKCTLDSAGDGRKVSEKWEEFKPTVIILDMMLPGRSGFLAIEDIRKVSSESERPVIIMITGNLGSRHKTYAKCLGVADYILKPFRLTTLMASIVKCVKDRNTKKAQ